MKALVKITLAVVVIIAGLLVGMLTFGRHQYAQLVEFGEQNCRDIAVSDPGIDLDAGQITCDLVHDDILMRFRVNASEAYFVECTQDAIAWGAGALGDCALYGSHQ